MAGNDRRLRLEHTFKLTEFKDGTYGAAIFAQNFSGEAQIARVKVEAISERALAESTISLLDSAGADAPAAGALDAAAEPDPKAAPQMTFHAFGRPTPQAVAEHDRVPLPWTARNGGRAPCSRS